MPATPTGLTATQITYNGFTFPPATTVRIQSRFEYATDGRSIKYTTYQATVGCVLTGGDSPNDDIAESTDDNLESIRQLLSKPGGALTIKDIGFGNDLDLAAGSELTLGPRPQILEWLPLGGANACRLSWQVEFSLPECSTVSIAQYLEFTYEVDFTIDEAGITTRTISGTVEIPTLLIGLAPSATADDFWLEIANRIPPIIGCQRRTQRRLSRDKRTLSFSVVDAETQSGNPYPEGVARITASHRTSSRLSDGFGLWENQISASIELLPGVPRQTALRVFDRIARPRILRAARYRKDKDGQIKPSRVINVESVSISEEIFGRTTTIDLNYVISADLASIIGASGLWQILNTNWESWSVTRKRLVPDDGHLHMRSTIADDAIVSICAGNAPFVGSGQNVPRDSGGSDFLDKPPAPEPNQSWLDFQNNLTIDQGANVAVHQLLGGAEAEGSPTSTPESTSWGISNPYSSEGSRIQQRGLSRWDVFLTGYALRIGYVIQHPTLYQYQGQQPILVERQVHQGMIGYSGSGPIVAAKWRLHYTLPAGPSGALKIPDNRSYQP